MEDGLSLFRGTFHVGRKQCVGGSNVWASRYGPNAVNIMESKTDLLGKLGCRLMAAYLLSNIINL